MVDINYKRMVPKMKPPFVVFLFGIRINNYWKILQWLPVVNALKAMMKELDAHPESGYLGAEYWKGNPRLYVQYWRSMEDLQNYARNKSGGHFPMWVQFNEKVSKSGAVGLWHESYLVKPDCFEAVYKNMPEFGLGRVGGLSEGQGPRIKESIVARDEDN